MTGKLLNRYEVKESFTIQADITEERTVELVKDALGGDADVVIAVPDAADLLAEGHGAQADGGDGQRAAAEGEGLHRVGSGMRRRPG